MIQEYFLLGGATFRNKKVPTRYFHFGLIDILKIKKYNGLWIGRGLNSILTGKENLKNNSLSLCRYDFQTGLYWLATAKNFNKVFEGESFEIKNNLLKKARSFEAFDNGLSKNGFITSDYGVKIGYNENNRKKANANSFILMPKNYKFNEGEEIIDALNDKEHKELINFLKEGVSTIRLWEKSD